MRSHSNNIRLNHIKWDIQQIGQENQKRKKKIKLFVWYEKLSSILRRDYWIYSKFCVVITKSSVYVNTTTFVERLNGVHCAQSTCVCVVFSDFALHIFVRVYLKYTRKYRLAAVTGLSLTLVCVCVLCQSFDSFACVVVHIQFQLILIKKYTRV